MLEIPEASDDCSHNSSASSTYTDAIDKTATSSPVQTKSLEGFLKFKVDISEGKVGNIFYLYIALRSMFINIRQKNEENVALLMTICKDGW